MARSCGARYLFLERFSLNGELATSSGLFSDTSSCKVLNLQFKRVYFRAKLTTRGGAPSRSSRGVRGHFFLQRSDPKR